MLAGGVGQGALTEATFSPSEHLRRRSNDTTYSSRRFAVTVGLSALRPVPQTSHVLRRDVATILGHGVPLRACRQGCLELAQMSLARTTARVKLNDVRLGTKREPVLRCGMIYGLKSRFGARLEL